MIILGIFILIAGFYLGWKAGSKATTERFRQEEENRLLLEAAKLKQQKEVEARVRAEDTERKRVQKKIEAEERDKKK